MRFEAEFDLGIEGTEFEEESNDLLLYFDLIIFSRIICAEVGLAGGKRL